MNPVVLAIIVHAFCGLFALGSGCVLFFHPKRNQLHKRLGRYYAAALITVDVTSWLLYFMRGSALTAFHFLALANLFVLGWGIGAAVFRRPKGKWYRYHYYLIAWSYVGLISATLVEFAVKTGQVTSYPSIAAITLCPVIAGGVWIEWKSRQLGDIPSRQQKSRQLQTA